MSESEEKPFDAVRYMREQRDRISRDIEGMTFDQQKAYFQERLTEAREANRDPHTGREG